LLLFWAVINLSLDLILFQHDAGRKAFEDAERQMDNLREKIKAKNTYKNDIQTKIQKSKLEASEARRLEQVTICDIL